MTTAETLTAVLRGEKLRITRARRAICAVLAAGQGEHLSASDIRARASRRAGTSIDQSTVYRTLEVLENLGYIHHVHMGHGPGVFHLSGDADHHHLVCDQCGTATDVPLAELAPLFRAVTDRYGFVADGHHFALSGRCARCEAGHPM